MPRPECWKDEGQKGKPPPLAIPFTINGEQVGVFFLRPAADTLLTGDSSLPTG